MVEAEKYMLERAAMRTRGGATSNRTADGNR